MNLKRSIVKRVRRLRALGSGYNFEKKFREIPENFTFKETENPLVSIVIPVYNQFRHTKACLWSILKNTEGIDYEIIIGDDNSIDETTKIESFIDGLIISRNDKNQGFLLNVNKSVTLAKGKYIVLMNNDVFVKKDWLKYFLETIESDENIGYVGAKYLNEKGLIHEAGCQLHNDGSISFCHSGELANSKASNQSREVDYCSACGVIFRRETWQELGGFDERFIPGYCEDVDFCLRIKHKLGLKVVYQPKAEMYHLQGATHGKNSSVYGLRNQVKLLEKWEDLLNV